MSESKSHKMSDLKRKHDKLSVNIDSSPSCIYKKRVIASPSANNININFKLSSQKTKKDSSFQR